MINENQNASPGSSNQKSNNEEADNRKDPRDQPDQSINSAGSDNLPMRNEIDRNRTRDTEPGERVPSEGSFEEYTAEYDKEEDPLGSRKEVE